MQEFHELIKNFDKIRDYMRQFYVYGFKVRSDFDAKSARTYDNERRRIESWLGDYTRSGYTAKGKHLYISVDGKTIPRNPLYAAWKSKTFTDNDLLLHFFLTDLLTENEQGMTAGELCDSIVASYGCVFDSQTIRLKLKEYESLGLLFSEKKGKALYYRLAPDLPCEKGAAAGEADPSHGLWERILTAVKFFSGSGSLRFCGKHDSGSERCPEYLISMEASFHRPYTGGRHPFGRTQRYPAETRCTSGKQKQPQRKAYGYGRDPFKNHGQHQDRKAVSVPVPGREPAFQHTAPGLHHQNTASSGMPFLRGAVP